MTVPRYSIARNSIDDGSGLRLCLTGEFDLASHDDLLAEILGAIDDNFGHLLVDLEHVSFVDSGGVGVLVTGLHSARAAGRGYQIVNAQGLVRQVLEITGVYNTLADGDGARVSLAS